MKEMILQALLKPQNIVYIYVLISSIVLGKQALRDKQDLNAIIEEQLEGKFSAQADLIRAVDEKVGKVKSEMVTHKQLQERAASIIETLDESTQKQIKDHLRTTGAKIDSVRQSVFDFKREFKNEGAGRVVIKTPPASPKPRDWKGIKSDDLSWCVESPSSCAMIPYHWRLPKTGKPYATLDVPNILSDESTFVLDLDFRLTVLTMREDPTAKGGGVVRNQGVTIEAGYSDGSKWHTVQRLDIKNGDSRMGGGKFIYAPTITHGTIKEDEEGWFEVSVFTGFSYMPTDGWGVSLGTSLINITDELKAGMNVAGNIDRGLLGGFVTYSPELLGKRINISPYVGMGVPLYGEFNGLVEHINGGLMFKVW